MLLVLVFKKICGHPLSIEKTLIILMGLLSSVKNFPGIIYAGFVVALWHLLFSFGKPDRCRVEELRRLTCER